MHPLEDLGPLEVTVLEVLLEAGGRVVSRRELNRKAGLAKASERRCEALLVAIRRALGPDVVVNVRGRGWRLDRAAFEVLERERHRRTA